MTDCLLDLTRLVSRLGQGPLTGIDRVEAAWARCLAAREGRVLALVRSSIGYLLLDRAGIRAVLAAADGGAVLPPADWVSRLRRTGAKGTLARAETLARRHAIARIPRPLLRLGLRRHFPAGGAYFNIGHSNLTIPGLAAIGRAGLRRVLMIHDTIPLDHPEWSGPGTSAAFRAKLAAVSAKADLVLHLAHATRLGTEAQLAALGRVPPGLVTPLAVPCPVPGQAPPTGLAEGQPFFVALGTIEPRKNIGFLLRLWQDLPAPRPGLVILGRIGWEDPATIALARDAEGVKVIPGLPDSATAALMAGSRGLLFPSRAEGFGLPPVEAALLGIPVICAPLPVIRETSGDYPIYLEPDDIYSWKETITALSGPERVPARAFMPGAGVSPDWETHVNSVFAVLGQNDRGEPGNGRRK